jgi:hypothetical protein
MPQAMRSLAAGAKCRGPGCKPKLVRSPALPFPSCPKPHGALKQIVGAERQVVAGMNYRMILILTDGGRWRVQVWKKLDGTMQLSHFKRDN